MYSQLKDKIKTQLNSPAGKKFQKACSKISSAISGQKKESGAKVDTTVKAQKTSEAIVAEESDKKADARNNFGGVYNDDEMSRMERSAEELKSEEEIKEANEANEVAGARYSESKVEKLEEDIGDENALGDSSFRKGVVAEASLDGSAMAQINSGGKDFDEGSAINDLETEEVKKLESQLKGMVGGGDPEKRSSVEKMIDEKSNGVIKEITHKSVLMPTPDDLAKFRKDEE